MSRVNLTLVLVGLLLSSCAAYTKKELADASTVIKTAVASSAAVKQAVSTAEKKIAAENERLRPTFLSMADPVGARQAMNSFRAKVLKVDVAVAEAKKYERFTVRNKTDKLSSKDLWEWSAEAKAWKVLADLSAKRVTEALKELGAK